ncbi:hypothetical protein [Flavobacterium sp. UBA4197]|uniref:hypothetical protein n=1 Tax=Flavobacterium sp. UBA4197 TaxID=1946546 RepID=UPI002579FE29|nr:hypothetical protein [Flavobacterium sp. UBA4197]
MLQKMKELGVLFSLCFVCVFSGCEKDTFEETFEKKGNPLTIKKLPFESLKNNPALLHKLEQLNAKKAAFFGKMVTDPIHNFSFDTEDVTYIENGSHHSYTFPIVRTVPGLYVENLVLNREEDGVYHAYITTYKLSREQVLRLGTVGSLNDKMTIRALPDFDMAVLGKGKLKPCHTLITVPVAWNEQGQVTHSELIELIDKDCIDQLNSGGQTSTGDGNSGNGGASDGGWGGWMGTGYDTGVYNPPGTDTGNDTGAEGNVGHVGGGGAAYGDGSPVITTPVVPMTFTSFIKNFKQGVSQLVPDHQWWNTTNGKKIVQYLQHNFNTQTGSVDFQVSEFVTWAVTYLINNPSITFDHLLYNRVTLENDTGDYENNSEGNYDNTIYEDFNPQQNSWPDIPSVIPVNQFIGWGTPNIKRNCMDYAKAQIAKKGYSISNYYDLGQTFQIYTEQSGVNHNQLSKGLSYLKYALSNGIPVIVGIDNYLGNPGNPDQTTDHFVVIVGMGSNTNGNYFQFYDNASGDSASGANPLNLLYYHASTGIISGNSQTSYAQTPSLHKYIITQIRKSK